MDKTATDWAHSPNETGEPEPLIDHLELVAQVCERFAGRFGAGSWGRAAGLWHDLGKYSREFQAYIRGTKWPDRDHSTAGAQYAHKHGGDAGKLLAYAIAGHHAGVADYHGELDDRLENTKIPEWQPYAIKELLEYQPANKLPITFDKEDTFFQLSFLVRMLFSALVDADFLATESFLNRRRNQQRETGAPLSELAGVLEAHLARISNDRTPVNRTRREILRACVAAAALAPGLFSLTVPTGGGKTLSALMFALKHAIQYGMERVIVVVPYCSIIEQNAQVYRDIFSAFNGATVVEHHSLFDNEKAPFCMRLATENWDGSIIVTTAVQFYDSLFANKPSACRKLHRIARSVVILDEAQTLPIGLLAPCLSALRALVIGYGTSVVLCTATQPALEHKPDFLCGLKGVREIIPDPVALYNSMRRVNVRYAGELADEALLTEVIGRKQVLTIVNTTRHAALLAEALSHYSGAYHLSARMCPMHRFAVLARIKQRLRTGEECRVVSTPVIEAGVDIDFPIVYRALCGLDSLAQAAGRCNREGTLASGEVIFFDADPIDSLKAAADAASQILPDHLDDPLSLDAVEEFFRLYYWARGNYDTKGILPLLVASGAEKGQFQFRSAAEEFALIDSPTKPVVIPWEIAGSTLCDKLRQSDLTNQPWLIAKLSRVAQRYSVNVYPDEFRKLEEACRIELVQDSWWVLRDMSSDYSETVGLLRHGASGHVTHEIG